MHKNIVGGAPLCRYSHQKAAFLLYLPLQFPNNRESLTVDFFSENLQVLLKTSTLKN